MPKIPFSGLLLDLLRATRKSRLAMIGLCILIAYAIMAIIGPIVVPLDITSKWEKRLLGPSLEHPLGTDYAGRDVFSQIIHGSRDVLIVGTLASLFSVLIAVLIGTPAGYVGGAISAGLDTLMNILLTIPSFPVMLIFASFFKAQDPITLSLILSIWMWAALARAIRAQVIEMREREFVEALRCLGLPSLHIIFREILPNLAPYIVINFIKNLREAITACVGMMFLGIARYSPTNWGVMLNLAFIHYGVVYSAPLGLSYVLSPLLAMVFLQFGAICFSRGIEEVVAPRLREYE